MDRAADGWPCLLLVPFRPSDARLARSQAGDDGPGTGHGLAGIRERGAIYGGDLQSGRRAEGGYALRPPSPGRVAVIGVLIADDQRLVRAGLRMILTSEPDLTVVGEAGDGHDAVAESERLRPEVVRKPGIDGIEATRRIMRTARPPRIIVLTTFDRDDHVYEALRSGASAFLLKDAPEHQLLAAIRVAVEGASLFAPAVAAAVAYCCRRPTVSSLVGRPVPSPPRRST
jgi:DNA-binding NarL/FixJ family response regulator